MNWLTKQMMIKCLSDKKRSVNLSFHSYTDPCYTDLFWLDTFVVYCQLITRMLQKQSFFFCFFLIYFFIFCVQFCLSVAIINFRQTCDCKRGLLTGKADIVNAVSRGSIVFSSSFQWLYVQLFFCVCFFPFKLRKPSLHKYDLYRLLCLTAALLDCIFIMDSVIFQEVLCISLCLQHSTAFHMIIWFITVVIVFFFGSICQSPTLWLNTTWFPQEYCLSVSQLISSGCDDSQHVGLGYKHHYSLVFWKKGSCAGPVCAWSQEFAKEGVKKEFASHSHSLSVTLFCFFPPSLSWSICFALSRYKVQGVYSCQLKVKVKMSRPENRELNFFQCNSWTVDT